MGNQDFITVRVAASRKYLGLSCDTVQRMCTRGMFRSAHKPGMGKNAHWKILRSEIIKHKYQSHPNPNYEL